MTLTGLDCCVWSVRPISSGMPSYRIISLIPQIPLTERGHERGTVAPSHGGVIFHWRRLMMRMQVIQARVYMTRPT